MITKVSNSKGQSVKVNVAPSTNKNAMGLYGNIFGYGNAGRFKYRYYTLSDSSAGLDTYSRELLVRWSREMAAQNPTISAAIDILAQFTVGDAYTPVYKGNDKEWGKLAIDWLTDDWYPNCCNRGSSYPFKTCLSLLSQAIDTDGDILQVFGQVGGFPKFQVIPSHRIKNLGRDGQVMDEGKYKGCVMSDGVIYSPSGEAKAFAVSNADNLVNSSATQTPDMLFDSRDARLIFNPRFFDKNRGIPSIGSAILQAISLQELDQYEMDKLKIQSMIGLVEHNASGEAPQELQNTFQQLLQDSGGNGLTISPNDHAIKIVQGPEVRYVRADGGDIKTLATSGPTNDAQEYMTKLETQVLSTLGVPHQLIFSTNKIGGRVTSAAAEVFRNSITKRQTLLDNVCKLTVGFALAKAIEGGLLPPNNEENLAKIIEFTHPPLFSLDARYDNDIVIDNLNSGVISLNEATTRLNNKTASETMAEQEQELLEFYTRAKKISDLTGRDINLVISEWKQTSVKVTSTIKPIVDTNEDLNKQQP